MKNFERLILSFIVIVGFSVIFLVTRTNNDPSEIRVYDVSELESNVPKQTRNVTEQIPVADKSLEFHIPKTSIFGGGGGMGGGSNPPIFKFQFEPGNPIMPFLLNMNRPALGPSAPTGRDLRIPDPNPGMGMAMAMLEDFMDMAEEMEEEMELAEDNFRLETKKE
jgi:hypothetical protein